MYVHLVYLVPCEMFSYNYSFDSENNEDDNDTSDDIALTFILMNTCVYACNHRTHCATWNGR